MNDCLFQIATFVRLTILGKGNGSLLERRVRIRFTAIFAAPLRLVLRTSIRTIVKIKLKEGQQEAAPLSYRFLSL
jgi:hypothetical protein